MPTRFRTISNAVALVLAFAFMGKLLVVAGCTNGNVTSQKQTTATAVTYDNHAARVADHLTGSFSSAVQAQSDPDNYFDIRLHAAPIWTDIDTAPSNERAHWLYVEQAAANALGRPYRQRIYRVSPVTDAALRAQGFVVQSEVFTFPNPLTYAGAWQNPARLNTLTPANLEPRSGCTVYLKIGPGNTFTGNTIGTGCESSLAGATHATSEVTLEPNRIIAWDRGLDENLNQVWGPTTGPYIFQRINQPNDNTNN